MRRENLNKWFIFWIEKDERHLNVVKDELQSCFKAFWYGCGKPTFIIARDDKDMITRIQELEDTDNIDLIFVIISGPKQNNRTYNSIKRITMNDKQIPTQFINSQTIAKGKNIRSILNRILMQMWCKTGGAPWGISDLPYNEPMMVMGLSIWKKSQKSQCSSAYPHPPGEGVGVGARTITELNLMLNINS